MLAGIKIKNFKKFKELNLQEFSRVNVFVGDNNSGKSTVLEAIELAGSNDFYNALQRSVRVKNVSDYKMFERMPLRTRPDLIGSVKNFLFNNVDEKQITLRLPKINSSIDTIISIEISDNITQEQIDQVEITNSDERNSFIKQSINYKVIVNNVVKNTSSIMVDDQSRFMRSTGKPFKLYDVVYFQDIRLGLIGEMYSNLTKSKKKDLLIDSLQKFDNNIINIELLNDEFFVDIGKDVLFPLNYLGSGIVSIIYLIIHMLNIQNGVLLIDELENGIYYKKFDTLIKVIDQLSQSQNIQLFITTHSKDFISRLDGFMNLTLFRLNESFEEGVICWNDKEFLQYVDDLRTNKIDIR